LSRLNVRLRSEFAVPDQICVVPFVYPDERQQITSLIHNAGLELPHVVVCRSRWFGQRQDRASQTNNRRFVLISSAVATGCQTIYQRPCNTPLLRPGKLELPCPAKGIQQGDQRSPRPDARLSRVQRKIFKVERSASSDTGDSPYALVALKPRARSCLRHRIVPRSMSKFVDEATQTINILILVSFDPNDVVGGQQTRQPILNSGRSRPRMTRSELLVKWSV
jgi:hypothetical protein